MALAACNDQSIKGEIVRNIAYYYYSQKDKVQFQNWADKAKKVLATNPKAMVLLDKWEAELNR